MTDMRFIQHPKGNNKFLNVADLLEFADTLRKQEVPLDELIRVDGVIGWNSEVRGLAVKEKKH